MKTKLTNTLAHLPQDVTIDRYAEHPDSIEIFISYPEEERVCPSCGSHGCVIHDSGRSRTVRHIRVSNKTTLLTFKVQRYRCKDCGITFTRVPAFVRPGFHLSQAAFIAVCEGLMSMTSIHQIAIRTGTTDSIVEHVMMSVDFRLTHLPQTLCIDEFKGSSGSWDPSRSRWKTSRFHLNLADGDTGRVIDILPRIDARSLTDYFFSFPLEERRKVRFVCCDMHSGFIKVARQCFPNVTVCADNFHSCRLVSQEMESIRISLWNHYRSLASKAGDKAQRNCLQEKADLFHSSGRLLLTRNPGPGSLSSFQEDRLLRILSLSPELCAAYDTYQEFLSILHQRSYALQRSGLSSWIARHADSEVPEVSRAAARVQHYRTYILNAWKYGKSNAACEGLNNSIKVLKRNEYGAHSFLHFRQRILFCLGYTKFVQDTFSMASQKKPAGKGPLES